MTHAKFSKRIIWISQITNWFNVNYTMEWNYKIQSNYVVFVFTKFSISFNEISKIKEQISSNEFSTLSHPFRQKFLLLLVLFRKIWGNAMIENIRCCIRVHKINLELYFQDLWFKYFLEQRFENTFHRKKFVNYTNLQHIKTKSFQTSIKNHELVSWEDLKNAHFFASHKVKSNLSSIIFNFCEY